MRAATTTRPSLAWLSVLLLLAPAAARSAPDGPPGSTPAITAETASVAAEKRWHLELDATTASPRDLRETRNDTPAPEIGGNAGRPWERTWGEELAVLSLRRDILDDGRRGLALGLHLGAAVGRFAAGNTELGFSETWRTKPALLWGLSLAGELRGDPHEGPFLRARGDYNRARAPEDVETVTSIREGTSGDFRDARFSWQRTDLSVGLGWRWRALAPMAGISYNRLVLKKRVHFHIPIPATPDPAPSVGDVPQRLNSRDSAFDYRSERLWNPHLGLEWRLSETWLVAVRCTFSGFPAYGLAARLNF